IEMTRAGDERDWRHRCLAACAPSLLDVGRNAGGTVSLGACRTRTDEDHVGKRAHRVEHLPVALSAQEARTAFDSYRAVEARDHVDASERPIVLRAVAHRIGSFEVDGV